MRTIQLPAQITGMSTRADGGYGVRIVTQEIPANEALLLLQYRGAIGWFLFKENEFNENEVPKEDANYEGKKPSVRLRNALYRYWEQQKQEAHPDFDAYYRRVVNGYADDIISKIE